MEVRTARPDEIAHLKAIEDSGDGVFRDIGYIPFPPEPEDDWSGAAVILVVGDPAVGFCRIDLLDGEPYLEQVSVLPSHMQQGIGTRLIAAAELWVIDQGYSTIWLTTFVEVPWNAPFYARLGYEIDESCGPELRSVRDLEASTGLDLLGPRCVMSKRF